jgi:hypothetical protein
MNVVAPDCVTELLSGDDLARMLEQEREYPDRLLLKRNQAPQSVHLTCLEIDLEDSKTDDSRLHAAGGDRKIAQQEP